MKLADRLHELRAPREGALHARMLALRRTGADIIDLAGDEPELSPSEAVLAAARAAVGESAGARDAAELRKAIARHAGHLYGRRIEPEHVVVTSNVASALWHACLATIGPGDEAVLACPHGAPLPEMVRLAGGRALSLPGEGSASRLPEPRALAAAITAHTRLVVIASPASPTGAVYGRDELADIAEILRAHSHIVVLCDDSLATLTLDGPFVSLAQVAPDLSERTILAGCVPPPALAGCRLGWTIGGPELASALERIEAATGTSPSPLVECVALAALAEEETAREETRVVLRRLRAQALGALQAISGLEVHAPAGGPFVFPKVSAYLEAGRTPYALAALLLEKAGVLVQPGEAHGSEAHVRLCYGVREESLAAGLARLRSGLEQLRP